MIFYTFLDLCGFLDYFVNLLYLDEIYDELTQELEGERVRDTHNIN